MGNDYIYIKEPMILLSNILNRWTGMTEDELAELSDKGCDLWEDKYPHTFYIYKAFIDKTGNKVYAVHAAKKHRYYSIMNGNKREYDFGNLAFTLSDIEIYEQQNPIILNKLVEIDDNLYEIYNNTQEIITCYEARKKLNMSSSMFVDLLNDDYGYRLVTSYEQNVREWIKNRGYYGSKNIEFFTIDMLSNENLYIETIDWECFQSEHPELFEHNSTVNNIPKVKDCDANKVEYLQRRIAELENELASKEQSQPLWGLPKRIAEMRKNGKTESEIAQFLADQDLPRKAIGALLRKDDSLIKDYGQWLDGSGLLPKSKK